MSWRDAIGVLKDVLPQDMQSEEIIWCNRNGWSYDDYRAMKRLGVDPRDHEPPIAAFEQALLQPDADAVRRVKSAMLESVNGDMLLIDSQFDDMARAALAAVPTVQAAAGDDLDAMLDSVNEDALLKLSAKGEAEWTAKVTWRNEKDHWVHSEGTGATRMAAIQDAVRQANASAEGERE